MRELHPTPEIFFSSLPAMSFFGETPQQYYHSDPLTLQLVTTGGEGGKRFLKTLKAGV